MTKKSSSRATKVVLASLLAASIAIPTAASANPISTSNQAASALKETIAVDQAVDFKVYKSGTLEPQPMISSSFIPQGTIVDKDGITHAKLTTTAEAAAMVAGFQTKQGEEFVDATSVKNSDGTVTYTFPLEVDKIYSGKVHVKVPTHDMWYDFDFKAQVAKKDTDAEPVSKVDVKVYKDGTKEESIMKDYMSATALVKKVADGNEVTLTFPKGGYIHGFKIAGKEVPVATDDKSTGVRTYTFKVADLTKLLNAELHVIVNEGPVNYDANHKVQLDFNSAVKPDPNPTPVVNPFKDIDKDGNKEAILALLDKGIVKEADKFNPRNNITRSQFALMVARALNLETTKDAGFKDLGKITDKERISAINALAEAGIVQKNEKFNPNNTLTRQQGALMLYRAIQFAEDKEIKKGDTTLPFYADGKAITDPEAKHAFALLYAEKIMTGAKQPDGKVLINSGDSLQRTQMAKILNGSLNFMGK